MTKTSILLFADKDIIFERVSEGIREMSERYSTRLPSSSAAAAAVAVAVVDVDVEVEEEEEEEEEEEKEEFLPNMYPLQIQSSPCTTGIGVRVNEGA
jgi:hypothetical protein